MPSTVSQTEIQYFAYMSRHTSPVKDNAIEKTRTSVKTMAGRLDVMHRAHTARSYCSKVVRRSQCI